MSKSEIRVAVIGATGYAGAEAVRLLAQHPHARVVRATSERSAGQPLRRQCPWLDTDLVLEPLEAVEEDFAFLCQEAGFAMQHAAGLIERGVRVIDLSADFRLKDAAQYETWYRKPHTAPNLLTEAVYGLTERADLDALAQAQLVANPGCYPTSAILALGPLIDAGLLSGLPVIDSKSGISGAGRSKNDTDYLFSEHSGGFKAYGVVGHRHTPEIEQGLGGTTVRFTPHLLPVPRGIHTTVHVPLKPRTRREDVLESLNRAYQGQPFVEVLEEGWPSIKAAVGSNRCILAADVDERTGYGVIASVIDNLIKGAAGQAIQNMNVMAGLPQETGLPRNGVWP